MLRKKNVRTKKKCLSASLPFFLERKYPLVCLFSYVWSAGPFLSASYVCACLPVFHGERSPQPPSLLPLLLHRRRTQPPLSHPVKWVPHGPCRLRTPQQSRQTPSAHKDAHARWTRTRRPRVQRSPPANPENATVWKWPLAQSNPPPPLLLSVRLLVLPCFKVSTESEGRTHANVVWLADWLDCWWAEVSGSYTGRLTGLSISHSSLSV